MIFFFHKIIYMSVFIVQIIEIEQLNYSCFMSLETELKLPNSIEANTVTLLWVNRRCKKMAMHI